MVRNLIIVGAGKQAQEILKSLDWRREPWVRVLGLFDDRASRVGTDIHGYQVLGSVGDVIEFTRNNEVDGIIIALPWSAGDRVAGQHQTRFRSDWFFIFYREICTCHWSCIHDECGLKTLYRVAPSGQILGASISRQYFYSPFISIDVAYCAERKVCPSGGALLCAA